jgi:uridine kinase
MMTDPLVVPFEAGKRLEDVALLSRSSLAAHLGMRDLGPFLDLLDQIALPAGARIFGQGDDAEHMYLVLEGHVQLRRGGVEVARLGPGDQLGETAIVGVRRRDAEAVAETSVRLARLARSRLQSLASNHPRIALHVTEAIAASLAATISSMSDAAGLLLQQRTLPRRGTVRVSIDGSITAVAMGTPARRLLPGAVDGALVVAAMIDHEPVSLDAPLTSDARLEPLTVASWEGRRIYRCSVGLVLLEAARRVLPGVAVSLGPRRGSGQLVHVPPGAATVEIAAAVEQRMRELVGAATPLREELWAVDEARARLIEQGWVDAAALVPFHRSKTVSLVTCGGTFALGLGPVAPNAGFLQGFAVSCSGEELVLDFGAVLGQQASPPRDLGPRATPVRGDPFAMTRELARWLDTLGVSSVGRFDRSCVTGLVDELIRVSEGFHEKHIGRIADRVGDAYTQGLRMVAVAGPSSSGKTTFIRRLKVQLEVNGIVPVHVSLDDYYVDRDRTPLDESGDYDFEAPGAIDQQRFRDHARRLLAGERVRTARYDFVAGKGLPDGGADLEVGPNGVLLVEGLHALDPAFWASLASDDEVFRVFVHPATALPFDRLTAVLPEDLRLLRRIVRDRHQRGYGTSESIRRWPSVRRGEERHVFACVGHADVVFDSSLVYELAVLRVYAERYLLEVVEEDPAHATAYRLRQLIDRFVPILPDRVPPTSILREFIGGSGFDG